MTPVPLLSLRSVTKVYPRFGGRALGFVRLAAGRPVHDGLKAVDAVTLDLARGECLGIVGRNGAGKSTLLQLACGIVTPDEGSMERRGRIAAMLELGAGFRPDFTGRENAIVNAALNGLDVSQAVERLPAIQAFSGIGEFFERPVREYSSGMRARLAFAVAANLDADVLVIDEVLAVGDAAFQQQCRRFIDDFLDRGAVIIVSHNDSMILSASTRAVWMEAGKLAAEGDAAKVLSHYRAALIGSDKADTQVGSSPAEPTRHYTADPPVFPNPMRFSPLRQNAYSHGNGSIRIEDLRFEDGEGNRLTDANGADAVTLVISGVAVRDVENAIAGFILRDDAGQNLFGDNSFETYRLSPRNLDAGQRFEARLRFRIPYLPEGTYSIAPSIISGTQSHHVHCHWIEEAIHIEVGGSPVMYGKIGVPYSGFVAACREKCE